MICGTPSPTAAPAVVRTASHVDGAIATIAARPSYPCRSTIPPQRRSEPAGASCHEKNPQRSSGCSSNDDELATEQPPLLVIEKGRRMLAVAPESTSRVTTCLPSNDRNDMPLLSAWSVAWSEPDACRWRMNTSASAGKTCHGRLRVQTGSCRSGHVGDLPFLVDDNPSPPCYRRNPAWA